MSISLQQFVQFNQNITASPTRENGKWEGVLVDFAAKFLSPRSRITCTVRLNSYSFEKYYFFSYCWHVICLYLKKKTREHSCFWDLTALLLGNFAFVVFVMKLSNVD